jgi:hypothetical protein
MSRAWNRAYVAALWRRTASAAPRRPVMAPTLGRRFVLRLPVDGSGPPRAVSCRLLGNSHVEHVDGRHALRHDGVRQPTQQCGRSSGQPTRGFAIEKCRHVTWSMRLNLVLAAHRRVLVAVVEDERLGTAVGLAPQLGHEGKTPGRLGRTAFRVVCKRGAMRSRQPRGRSSGSIHSNALAPL